MEGSTPLPEARFPTLPKWRVEKRRVGLVPMRGPLIIVFLLVGCVRTASQPLPELPPPAPKIEVPPGCLDSFAGPWIHASDPSYRYSGEDDGGTLVLTVSHVAVPLDAGFSPRRFRPVDAGVDAGMPDAGTDAGTADAGVEPWAVRVELQRTAHGFVGQTIAPLPHPTGRVCEAHFPTTVLSCADAGLLLETQSATALGDACQAPARPLGLLTQKHQLVRPDAG